MHRPAGGRFRGDPHPRRPRLPGRAARALRAGSSGPARRAGGAAGHVQRGELPDFPCRAPPRCAMAIGVSPRAGGPTDRRVEIMGPVDRKMMINVLNSGARDVHGRLRGLGLADVVDLVDGERNVRDAAANDLLSTPTRRPDGRPGGDAAAGRAAGTWSSATWRSARAELRVAVRRGAAPVPQLAAELIARQRPLPLPPEARGRGRGGDLARRPGRVRGPARAAPRARCGRRSDRRRSWPALEMDEIRLPALGEHATGSNAGRWHYISSVIKKFRDWHQVRPS